jgi:hypothetical protein
VQFSPSGRRVGGIHQEIGEYLPQGFRIDRKVFSGRIARFDPDTLGVQARPVKIDYGAKQSWYVGVLRPCRTSELMHCTVGDLGNAVYFFLGKRQVMTTRRGGLGFAEVKEIQERIEGIVDLVGERRNQLTTV